MKAACGTGHRTDKFKWFDENKSYVENECAPQCVLIKQMLKEQVRALISDGYDYFYTGMALGFDTWLAECVIELKKEFPNIKLEAAIPCYDQEKVWPNEEDRTRYHNILNQCDKKTYVSKDYYKPYYMIKRNHYMVDRSDIVIACYDGSPGGTREAYTYAINEGVEIINIDPNTMSVRRVKF